MAEIFEGIAIFSVDKGSTTHRCGVRAGDILIEVNGRRVRKIAEYAAARKLRDDLLELVVIRDGRSVRLWGHGAPQRPSVDERADEMPSQPPPRDPTTCPWRGAA